MNPVKKNISILNTSLTSGGAEKVISLLLKELIHDFNVTLILFYNKIHFPIPEEVEVVILGKKDHDIPFYEKALNVFKFASKYNEVIKRNKIDYVVSFLAFPNLLTGIISMLNKEPKTYISERGFPSDNTTSKTSHYISKVFYPLLYNKCDKLFSNSVHINNDLKDNFGVKIPMEIIYNPIEQPKKVIISSTLNTVSPLNIITAGTLNKRKNQIMIIRSVENLKFDFTLSILGGGELKEYLINEIDSRKLNKKVSLIGKVKNVDDYLVKSNCFVLSSFTEGFPNALLEGMAIGLPSISTNCLSGPLELLNDNKPVSINNGEFFKAQFGILVNNDDHIGLEKALTYLNDNPDEREKYSQLSLERSNDYLLKTIYSQFKDFILN
ncbi:MAG: glycosyltransferase [Algibacter sp.]|uniref:glycosyltransferase n=1 Tax=Algibacter sp. TaxID=1872428 RepID=UPI002608E570|nr:glycosyltransferase [Algibacter sp.]MDG1730912.1 glycosyltransferase [Algibacter sp.]MDG2179414.1 glycosyltransferase [Algibacter sp.]